MLFSSDFFEFTEIISRVFEFFYLAVDTVAGDDTLDQVDTSGEGFTLTNDEVFGQLR